MSFLTNLFGSGSELESGIKAHKEEYIKQILSEHPETSIEEYVFSLSTSDFKFLCASSELTTFINNDSSHTEFESALAFRFFINHLTREIPDTIPKMAVLLKGIYGIDDSHELMMTVLTFPVAHHYINTMDPKKVTKLLDAVLKMTEFELEQIHATVNLVFIKYFQTKYGKSKFEDKYVKSYCELFGCDPKEEDAAILIKAYNSAHVDAHEHAPENWRNFYVVKADRLHAHWNSQQNSTVPGGGWFFGPSDDSTDADRARYWGF